MQPSQKEPVTVAKTMEGKWFYGFVTIKKKLNALSSDDTFIRPLKETEELDEDKGKLRPRKSYRNW